MAELKPIVAAKDSYHDEWFEFFPDATDINFRKQKPFRLDDRVRVITAQPYEGILTGEVIDMEFQPQKSPELHRYRGLVWYGVCPPMWLVWLKLNNKLYRGYYASCLEKI